MKKCFAIQDIDMMHHAEYVKTYCKVSFGAAPYWEHCNGMGARLSYAPHRLRSPITTSSSCVQSSALHLGWY